MSKRWAPQAGQRPTRAVVAMPAAGKQGDYTMMSWRGLIRAYIGLTERDGQRLDAVTLAACIASCDRYRAAVKAMLSELRTRAGMVRVDGIDSQTILASREGLRAVMTTSDSGRARNAACRYLDLSDAWALYVSQAAEARRYARQERLGAQ